MNDTERCGVCDSSINMAIAKVPFRLYSCGHNYHLHCLKDKKCPLCIKQAIEIVSKSELRRKRPGDNNEDEDKERAEAL